MGVFLSERKLKAAVRSMHQFCPIVRTIFRERAEDRIVEAATVFLYEHAAREVFGSRFATRVRHGLREQYKFATASEIELRLDRMAHNLSEFARFEDAWNVSAAPNAEFTRHVRSAIRTFLAEAGLAFDDPDVVRDAFPRFEDAARRIKAHLIGLKRQSNYVMK